MICAQRASLRRIGVLESLLKLAPPILRLRMVFDDIAAPTADVVAITGAPGLSVRRITLDEILVNAAASAGADVRTQTAITGLVGADGTRSVVAKMVGAQEYHPTSNGRVFMWAYYEADPADGEMWIGPVRTMANLRGFFRPSAGPGWALVGDAGHFKDPTPGQGIADALRQSEQLAAAIQRALGGGAGNPDKILRDWWRWRDDDAWEMYWFARDMGAAGPTPPLRREAQRRIAADPELTTAMVRILNHELRPSEVFTPAFALTTMAQALRHGRGHRREILREARTAAVDELQRRLKSELPVNGSPTPLH